MTATQSTRIFAGGAYFKLHNGTQYRGGLFRTTPDDGQWQLLAKGLPENVESRIVVFHPTERDVVYAGTQDGPYRSLDGGDSWERLGFPERGAIVWSLAFHPGNPTIMYAGLAPVGLYRSTDGGDTWKKIAGGATVEHCPMNFPTRTIGIALDPARPDDIYIALEVIGVRRSARTDDALQAGFSRVHTMDRFHDILPAADFVILVVPLNDETFDLVGAPELALMKPSAMIVNMSRGPNVNREALAAALAANRIGGFGSDVWWTEPADPQDPLLRDPRVFITPHIGAESIEGITRMSLAARDNIDRLRDGRPLVNVVNSPAVATSA